MAAVPEPIRSAIDAELETAARELRATGHTMLSCGSSAPPTTAEITELLDRNAKQPEQLPAWADTPVGAALAGTTFTVTERHTA